MSHGVTTCFITLRNNYFAKQLPTYKDASIICKPFHRTFGNKLLSVSLRPSNIYIFSYKISFYYILYLAQLLTNLTIRIIANVISRSFNFYSCSVSVAMRKSISNLCIAFCHLWYVSFTFLSPSFLGFLDTDAFEYYVPSYFL